MPLNTYGDISPRTAAKAKVKLLERGQHLMVVERFGQMDPQQKNKTKSCTWRRYNSLPRATAPLAEGIPPTGQNLTYTDITATLEQYGDLVKITDVIADTHEDPIFDQALTLCAEQAAETVESLRINAIKAGSNVFYASGVAGRSSVTAAPTRADFRRIYRYFANHKAKRITRVISPSADYGTHPVDAAYICLAHTDLDADIRAITGFVSKEYYAQEKAFEGEIGKVEQFRIILTPMFEPWLVSGASGTTYLSGGVAVGSSAACDVYPMIFIAQDAYGLVPLQGFNSITPMVKNPSPDKADPLGQFGFVSWKTYQTAAILNQAWLARLEVAATATPA